MIADQETRLTCADGTVGEIWVRGENRIRPVDFGVPPLRSWLVSMKESVLARFDLILSKAN